MTPSASRAAPHFQALILGGFSLSCNEEPVDMSSWPRRAATLVRLLAVSPGQRRLRDDVVEIIWPDATPEAGSSNLKSLLHRVRRSLDGRFPAPLVLARGWVVLNPDCRWTIDLDRFRQIAQSAGEDLALLREAAELAASEPLQEDRYEDWAAPVREQVYQEWREICLRLARLHRVWGSREDAVHWFERILARDPLDEEALQGLLSALGESGRRAEALRRYEQFAQRLLAELEVPPAEETVALAARLRAEMESRGRWATRPDAVVASYPLPASGSLVGRDRARTALLTALSAASGTSSTPRLVLLAGEAGMGKTRLLGEASRLARKHEMLVLAGGCYEQEDRLPYGPIRDALLDFVRAQPDPVLRSCLRTLPEIARILPEVRDRLAEPAVGAVIGVESQRLGLFSAVTRLMAHIASERPVALLLDDLQWADDVSLQLLHYLLRQPSLSRLTVVGAFREEEVAPGSALETLLQTVDIADVVRLSPLSPSDLACLLKQDLDAPGDEQLVTALHERSAGNPLFALQMTQMLEREGRLVRDGHAWRLAPGTTPELPRAVREVIARRLRQAGPEEREVLALGAILGREFAYPALEALWEGSERALFAALDAAVGLHIVAETEAGYSFQHPLLWEVVYQGTPVARRAVLHGRAGLALERLYGSGGDEHRAELAYHFEAAGPQHRGQAVHYLTLAGDLAAQAYAWSEAHDWYSRALVLADNAPDGPDLHRKRGAVLKTMGHYREAIAELSQAVQQYVRIGDRAGQLHTAADIGRVHLAAGTLEAGIAGAQAMLASVPGDASASGRAALYLTLAFLCFEHGQYSEQLEAAEQAAALATVIGDNRLLAEARLARAYALPVMDHAGEFAPAVEDVIVLAEETGDLTTLCRAHCALGPHYAEKGDMERATRHLDRALDLVHRIGDRSRIGFVSCMCGLVAFWRGEWDEACGYYHRSLAIYQEIEARPDTMIPLLGLGTVAMSRGQWETGARYLHEYLDLARAKGDRRNLAWVYTQLAERELLEGHPERAFHIIEQVDQLPEQALRREALPMRARTYAAMGRLAQAEEMASEATEWARATGMAMVLAEALCVQGGLLVRRGLADEAERCLQEALSLAQRSSRPRMIARTLYAYGIVLLEQHRLEPARERLEEALAIFRTLGAHAYVACTEQALANTCLDSSESSA